jgi:hypothetical protein
MVVPQQQDPPLYPVRVLLRERVGLGREYEVWGGGVAWCVGEGGGRGVRVLSQAADNGGATTAGPTSLPHTR